VRLPKQFLAKVLQSFEYSILGTAIQFTRFSGLFTDFEKPVASFISLKKRSVRFSKILKGSLSCENWGMNDISMLAFKF
jgi:hypothetical protein